MSGCCLFCGGDIPEDITYIARWRGLSVNWNTHEIWYEGKEFPLRGVPTKMLFLLVRAKGRPVAMSMFEPLIGEEAEADNIRVHICNLRKWLARHVPAFEIPKQKSWAASYFLKART